MDFDAWFRSVTGTEPFESADDETVNTQSSMYVAYLAGWNACRDKWGGMTYKQTKELDLFLDAGE